MRPFRCKCGKAYLSYPALYTHIKHKTGDKRNHARIDSTEHIQPTKRGRPPAKDECTRRITELDILEDMNNEARNEIELLLIELIQNPAENRVVLEGNEYPSPADMEQAFERVPPALRLAADGLLAAFQRVSSLSEEELYRQEVGLIGEH